MSGPHITALHSLVMALDSMTPNEVLELRAHAFVQMKDFTISPTRRIIWKYQHSMLKRLCKVWHITGRLK